VGLHAGRDILADEEPIPVAAAEQGPAAVDPDAVMVALMGYFDVFFHNLTA
jgi:hypothetical protein